MTQTSGIGSAQITGSLIEKTDRAAQAEKQSKVAPANISKATTSQDAANLSGAGSVLASAAAKTDDVRTERVEALKAAINSGAYNVSAGDVADKLLDNMLE